MKEINGIKFSDSIGVLYELKEKKGCKTLQETYKCLDVKEVDGMLEILNISYNKANKDNPKDFEGFIELLDEKHVTGLYAIGKIYSEIIEALMFSGLSPEEIQDRKNQLANLMKS